MQDTYETNRLLINRFALTDVTDVADMFEDQELNLMSGLRLPETRPEKLMGLTMLVKTQNSLIYILRNKKSGNAVGLVVFYRMYLLNYVYSELECEIGFVLSRDSWQQGLMSEALRQLISAYFEETDFVGIYAGAHSGNVRSQALLKRMGFQAKKVPRYLSEDQFDEQLEYFYLSESMLND